MTASASLAAEISATIDRDAPAARAKRSTICSSFRFADLVADDPADNRAANSTAPAAAGKNGTADGAGSSADRGVLVLR
jgi:hypothetical protein